MRVPFDIVAAENLSVLTDDDLVVDPSTALPQANWSKLGTVVNRVDISYDYNVAGLLPNTFARRQIYSATTSVQRYTAQPSILLECRGLRSSLGAQAVLDRLALIFLQRWGYPPPILLCSVPFRQHLVESGDHIYLSSSVIVNPETGRVGLDNERFEVLTVSPQFLDALGRPNGRLDLALLWVGNAESSAAPTSGGILSLIPGETTISNTDVNIPFASSATVTTPGPACNQFRIGLKGLNYLMWSVSWMTYLSIEGTCYENTAVGEQLLFNTQITYHLEYKVSTAPDAPGSGGDPSTGWVTLLGSTSLGNTSLVSYGLCGAGASAPGEQVWTHYFPSPGGAPAVYNIKAFFDSALLQPAPTDYGLHGISRITCGQLPCPDIFLTEFVSIDQRSMTIDFIEGIV